MDMFTQWCPPQKKRKEEKGMVTSQGGMSEALVPLSRWPPKGAGSKKPPPPHPQQKGHVATFPVAHALEMHFSRSVINAELDT